MERVLLIMAASVLGAVSSLPRGVYHFVYEPKSWAEAQSFCREMYSELATVRNMEDVGLLKAMADPGRMIYPEYSHRAWVGLYNSMTSWGWSMLDGDFYGPDELEFRNWNTGEPNYAGGRFQCAEVYTSGVWNDAPCDWKGNFICADVRGRNATFVYISIPMTWAAAQSYCRQHHSDLASVRSMAENGRVTQVMPAGSVAWIGLSRDAWKWADGSNSSFSYWGANDPDGHRDNCAAANFMDSGKWESWVCDEKKAFVCYSDPALKQVVRLRLAGSSSLDLNDPAVLEDLLKKLKQKLKDQGVKGDIRLSWRKQSDGKIFHKEEKEDRK